MSSEEKQQMLSDAGPVASKWLETALQGFIKERNFDADDRGVRLRAYCCFMVECMCRMIFAGVHPDILRDVTLSSIKKAEAIADPQVRVTSKGGVA